jgi:cell division protein FtsA
LTQGAFRVIGAANTRSRGVRFGEIAEMEETERAVMTAIQAAQKMANLRVDHVIVGFSGGRPRSYGCTGEARCGPARCASATSAHVLAAASCRTTATTARRSTRCPVNFVLDTRTGLTDPRGQIGKKLEVDMHLLTVGATPLQNILHCLRRCDLELAGIVASSYASGLAALVEDEQELGAACVDIGGGATGLSIFVRRQMIYADAVRMGGATSPPTSARGCRSR